MSCASPCKTIALTTIRKLPDRERARLRGAGARRYGLVANGQFVLDLSLGRAPIVQEEMEEQAAVYWGTLAIGEPNLLSEAQMADNIRQFGHHGQKK